MEKLFEHYHWFQMYKSISSLFSFLLLFFFSDFILFYFTILYWFCHTSKWIRHRCTCVPDPEPPFHLPPHTISLGHPSAPAPSILYPASNLDWRFISYMILYMDHTINNDLKKKDNLELWWIWGINSPILHPLFILPSYPGKVKS